MKKLLLLIFMISSALSAEVTKPGQAVATAVKDKNTAEASKSVQATSTAKGINKEKLQEVEQKIKAAEKKYHESVQATENAKKNNASKDEIARLEKQQEEAKSEWQKEKSAK